MPTNADQSGPLRAEVRRGVFKPPQNSPAGEPEGSRATYVAGRPTNACRPPGRASEDLSELLHEQHLQTSNGLFSDQEPQGDSQRKQACGCQVHLPISRSDDRNWRHRNVGPFEGPACQAGRASQITPVVLFRTDR